MPGTIADARMTPVGHQQLTNANLATAVALTVPTGAVYALIQAYSASDVAIRWRDDGTDPTTTVGVRLKNADIWYVGNLSAIKLIRESSGVEVNIAYYKCNETW